MNAAELLRQAKEEEQNLEASYDQGGAGTFDQAAFSNNLMQQSSTSYNVRTSVVGPASVSYLANEELDRLNESVNTLQNEQRL